MRVSLRIARGPLIQSNPLREIQRLWEGIRAKAKFGDTRIHDLRLTFASLLVSGGMTLPMVGRLLRPHAGANDLAQNKRRQNLALS